MQVYHRTTETAAAALLQEGFRDATGFYGISVPITGVWVSEFPLTVNEGAHGDTLLTLALPEDIFQEYEWVEEDKPYREALPPAAVMNQYGPPRLVSEDEEERILSDLDHQRDFPE
jgi:hypothetical protein